MPASDRSNKTRSEINLLQMYVRPWYSKARILHTCTRLVKNIRCLNNHTRLTKTFLIKVHANSRIHVHVFKNVNTNTIDLFWSHFSEAFLAKSLVNEGCCYNIQRRTFLYNSSRHSLQNSFQIHIFKQLQVYRMYNWFTMFYYLQY